MADSGGGQERSVAKAALETHAVAIEDEFVGGDSLGHVALVDGVITVRAGLGGTITTYLQVWDPRREETEAETGPVVWGPQ